MKSAAAPFPSAGRRRIPGAWLLGLLLAGVPAPAGALDGVLDARQSDQHARSDAGSFRTYWRREALSVQQEIDLAPRLRLDAHFRALRETTGGDAAGSDTKFVRENRQPDLSLSYRTRPFTLGLNTEWLDQETSGSSALAAETTRRQHGAWMNLRLPSGTRLSSNVTRTVSDDAASGAETESRQTTGFALAEQALGGTWTSQYRFTALSGDLSRLDTHRERISHALELRGSPRFADDRVTTTLRVRGQFFDQSVRTNTTDPGAQAPRLETPLAAGVTLDDTPEQRDPLEGDVVPVPGLFDGDRETPTAINIGDAAAVVREFGGDYRNIEFDFGDPVFPTSATLFVHEPVIHPELIRWRAFVSDEPEGRVWEELSPARFTATYSEFGGLLQGWELTFAADVSGRFLKLVDVKSGSTNPDLYVTELEVFARTAAGLQESSDRTWDYRLDGSLAYDVTSRVRVGYRTALRRRDRQDSDRGDLTGIGHTLSTRWSDGPNTLGAEVDLHTLTSNTRRSTDVVTTLLSATHTPTSTSSATASFTRSNDRGGGEDRITDTYSMSGYWRPAPRLQLTHRLSHGRRTDHVYDIRSRSVTMSHAVRSNPWTTLMVNLDRSDRWVNRSAGAGFERFHSTAVDMVWTVAPRVTASSDLRVEGRRGDTEWSSRQTVTWSPLPAPRLETHISGNSFYDSGTQVRRWGSNVSVAWRPRRALILEGGVGVQRYEVDGVANTPVDTFVRGGLSF